MKRYRQCSGFKVSDYPMEESKDGEWVKYTDAMEDMLKLAAIIEDYAILYGNMTEPLPLGTIKAIKEE